MTYERGQYDDERRRSQRRVPEAREPEQRRTTSGAGQYSRSSNRYAGGGSARQGAARPARSQRPASGAVRQEHPDASQYGRERYVSRPGQQRAVPVSQQNFAAVHHVKPVNPKVLFIVGALAVALLVFIAVRFVTFGPTMGAYNEAEAAIAAANDQAAELEAANADMQAQIDEWQVTIDQYNSQSKK